MKSLPQPHTSRYSFPICCTAVVRILPPPAPDANLWSLESSFTFPKYLSDSGSAPAGNKTYCDKHCFPREVFYMAAGSKTVSAVGAPASHIVHVCCFVRLMMLPGVFGGAHGAALGWLVTLGPLLGAQVLWLTDKSQCTLPAGVKWSFSFSPHFLMKTIMGFINQRVLLGEVDGFVLLSF